MCRTFLLWLWGVSKDCILRQDGGRKMPRPKKYRQVCQRPKYTVFGPVNKQRENTQEKTDEQMTEETGLEEKQMQKHIVMTVDEYEVIRLIDLEGLNQEECAKQMGVARTTVQSIYACARHKIAKSMVEGQILEIAGGDVCFCEQYRTGCGCGKRLDIYENSVKDRDGRIKIAVTYENGEIFQHFGQTECFKIYCVDTGSITETWTIETEGYAHGTLAVFLKQQEVDVLICGGIGRGAQNALAEMEIRLYGGVQGKADQAVKQLLAGALEYNPNVLCSYHEQR